MAERGSSTSATSSVTLYTIRHGETAWNVIGKLQGQLDIPLNEHGEAQAQALASYISSPAASSRLADPDTPPLTSSSSSASSSASSLPPIVAIYSSDLKRAHATAEAIGKSLNIPVQIDARIRETNLGVWQGMNWDYVADQRTEEMHRWKTDVTFAMENGECVRDRFLRVACCLRDIVLRHVVLGQNVRVLVVSHGGTIDEMARVALAKAFGTRTELRKLNTAISILRCDVHEGDILQYALNVTQKQMRQEQQEQQQQHLDRSSNSGNNNSSVSSTSSVSPESGAGAILLDKHALFTNFTTETINPLTAGETIGKWKVVHWGILDHLHGLKQQAEEGKGGHTSGGAADSGNGSGSVVVGVAGGGTETTMTSDKNQNTAAASLETESTSTSLHIGDEEEAVSA